MLGASDKGGAALELDDANALIMAAREGAIGSTRTEAGGAGGEGVTATAFIVEPSSRSDGRGEADDGGRRLAAAPLHRRPARCGIATALLRFVVGPDGTIVPDIETRLPGRGLWLTPRRDIVDRAVAKRVFARAARRQVRCRRTSRIGSKPCWPGACCRLARAGQTGRPGGCRVRPGRRGGAARAGALLLCARDGAAGGRRKLAELGRDLPCAEC